MRKFGECGAATAEYTVGSLGAVFIAFWLSRIAIGDPDHSWFGKFIHRLITDVFHLPGIFSGDWAWRWMA